MCLVAHVFNPRIWGQRQADLCDYQACWSTQRECWWSIDSISKNKEYLCVHWIRAFLGTISMAVYLEAYEGLFNFWQNSKFWFFLTWTVCNEASANEETFNMDCKK